MTLLRCERSGEFNPFMPPEAFGDVDMIETLARRIWSLRPRLNGSAFVT